MYAHTRERDIRPGFDGVKIKFYYYYYILRQDVHVQHEAEGAPENSHGGETVHVRIVRDVVQSTDVDVQSTELFDSHGQ